MAQSRNLRVAIAVWRTCRFVGKARLRLLPEELQIPFLPSESGEALWLRLLRGEGSLDAFGGINYGITMYCLEVT
jgi:hypothetical protein